MVLNMQLETVGASSGDPIYKAANWGYNAAASEPNVDERALESK